MEVLVVRTPTFVKDDGGASFAADLHEPRLNRSDTRYAVGALVSTYIHGLAATMLVMWSPPIPVQVEYAS